MWCDLHKCGCQVWFVRCFSLSHPFPASASVSLLMSDPRCGLPICRALPRQRIRAAWPVQCTGGPLVRFALWPHQECPLSFCVAPFEGLSPTCKWGSAGGALKMATGPCAPLRSAGCASGTYGWERARGLTVFAHRRSPISVGVRGREKTLFVG